MSSYEAITLDNGSRKKKLKLQYHAKIVPWFLNNIFVLAEELHEKLF